MRDDGTTTITAKYGKQSDNASLTVTRETPPTLVAKFTYDDNPCLLSETPSAASPYKATCTFDASDSKAPAGSTYIWTLPGVGYKVEKTGPVLENAPIGCGLEDGVSPGTVSLTVKSGSASDSFSLKVFFSKEGPC